ncbi:hypothetical protein BDF21DRAFT_407551 [Thamnidium elegans]|uniref:Transmembrane protein 198 n=1 Tax=Thamnidium elegans TaxID=101142 RepID=A0A8H7SNF3_9FUNG|nr:hypothetical protein INT48_004109 [Thamnidium elegans]KAI8096137.1 hypothetical protein BDF21DRAFT_407551 [Thamnidium elegans]
MFKSNWLLWLLVLFHVAVTVTTSTEKIYKRGGKHDCDEEKSTTISKPTRTRTITSLTTRRLRPTSTAATENHACHSCQESACDHKCQDKPCKHQCKDSPCNVLCIYKSPPPKFEPQVMAVAILLMVIGVFLMIMGFPFFIVTMAFTGLLIGSCAAWVCLHAAEPAHGYPAPSVFYLAVSLGIGLLFAVASLFWWKVTVYMLCGGAGYLLSIYIWTWKEDFVFTNILARNIIGLAIGFVFILGFVLIEFVTIILSTSFIGAYVFVLGLDLFIKTGFLIGFKNILDFNRHLQEGGGNVYVDAAIERPYSSSEFYAHYTINTAVNSMLCGVMGLWILSTFWQRYYNYGRRFGLRVIINTNDSLKAKFEDSQTKKVKK